MKISYYFHTGFAPIGTFTGLVTLMFMSALGAKSAIASEIDCKLGVSLGSKHFVEGNFNENNPGVNLACGPKRENYYALSGVYRNSYNRTSVYAGAGYEWAMSKYAGLGVDAGFITGLENRLDVDFGPVTPLISPFLRIGTDLVAIKSHLLPGAVTLELQVGGF